MAEIKIHVRDKPPYSWSLPTGQRHVVRIFRLHADMVEMEDLHFHLDSAVMLPEREPADADDPQSGAALTGLSVLRACFLHAKANPSKKMLCTGHTDRSGPADLRARNVRAILNGDHDEWASVCAQKHVLRDVQCILKWVANVRYWPDCDPGPIDGEQGDHTNRALRAFKKRFNDLYGGSLTVDATVEAPTWKAFARMYDLGLASILQTDDDGLATYRQALTWQPPEYVGCGENHPITPDVAANYRSAVDRRVEILFFAPGQEPQLDACHPSADTCAPDQCELYRKQFLGRGFYQFSPIPVETNAKVALALTEVRGLYKPGYSDPNDVSAGTAMLAGYLKGYASDDDLGRIFINQIPRVDTSVSWEDVSPEVKDGAGRPYFAGRTVVFARHPKYTKAASAEITVGSNWSEGDDVSVTINGVTASYKVVARDVVVPSGAADSALFVSGQVGRGIEAAINNHPVLSAQVAAGTLFGKVRIRSLATGAAGNGTPITVSPATLALSGPELSGGGFDDTARREIVHVFTHELGHAFGFPHKCGYHTFENTPDTSCTMNYFNTWLYTLATQADPSARQVERFGTGKDGNNFCALHTRGIRVGRLEDNPVIWNW